MADLTGYASAQAEFARKRKMAEMLQQQAFRPTDTGLIPGSKMSLANPLAALFQGFVSNKLEKEAAEGEKADAKARQDAIAAMLQNIPQDTPGVAAQPIEQEAVGPGPTAAGPPPGPAAPPLAAAFGASGMPDVGPRDNELKGSASPMAALLAGGAPPPQENPLAPPGAPPLLPQGPAGAGPEAPPGPPPLLPQKMDMSIPGAAPKLTTDAIPGKTVSPQDWIKFGTGLSQISPEGAKIGEQFTAMGAKAVAPMTAEQKAELAQQKELKFASLQQQADAAKQRSEDTRLSIEQRAEAARMHDATMRELAAARRDAAAAARAGGEGSFAKGVEGASDRGYDIVRGKDGIPHEVINGVPSKDPYTGAVTPKTSQEKGVANAAKGSQGLKDMTNALNAVEADPSIFGPRATLGAVLPNIGGIGRAAGGLNEDQLKTRTHISSMTADITHSLYGSAFSAGEQARAKGFLIDPTDDAATVKAKLRGRMELEQEHYNNLPASAKAAATARQGGSGEWSVKVKGQ